MFLYLPVSGVEVAPWLPPLVAFLIASCTTSSGISGGVLLLPFQMSVLGFISPSVSPTNLIYNIVAIPGGLYRYIREGRMAWTLAWVTIAGTLPGIFAGALIRVNYLHDPGSFKVLPAWSSCILVFGCFTIPLRRTTRKTQLKKNLERRRKHPGEMGQPGTVYLQDCRPMPLLKGKDLLCAG